MPSVDEIRTHLNGAISKLPMEVLGRAINDLAEAISLTQNAAQGTNDAGLQQAIGQAQQGQQQAQNAQQYTQACQQGVSEYLARI